MSDVLIVGAGLVGTWAARELAHRGYGVLAVDLEPTPGYFSRYSQLPHSNLRKLPSSWSTALKDILHDQPWHAVIHAAGITANLDSGSNHSTISLLAEQLAGMDTRLIHISSFAVYGAISGSLSEQSTPAPRTSYGVAKLLEESVISEVQDLEFCVLRPCGVFGPIRSDVGSHSARFFDSALRRAIAHGKLELKGSPDWRDEYLYVRDLAVGIAQAVSADLKEHRTVNIGPGHQISIADVAKGVEHAVPGTKIKIINEEVAREPLAPLKIDLARDVLDFEPQFEFHESLFECAEFIRGRL